MGGCKCLVFCSHFVIERHSDNVMPLTPDGARKHILCTDVAQNNVSDAIHQRWMTHSSTLLYYSICFLLSDWFLCVRVCDMPNIQFSMCNY